MNYLEPLESLYLLHKGLYIVDGKYDKTLAIETVLHQNYLMLYNGNLMVTFNERKSNMLKAFGLNPEDFIMFNNCLLPVNLSGIVALMEAVGTLQDIEKFSFLIGDTISEVM